MLIEDAIVESLWNVPGQSIDQLLDDLKVTDRLSRLRIRTEVLDKLIGSNRVSIVRFTTYAPDIRTTFFYFATAVGQIEIIDNKQTDWAGFQVGHIHDPMGLWDVKMEEALKD